MELKKTALYDTHTKLGAKMIPFAGFYMPLWYSSGIAEHMTVRRDVGIFDVSHMGEFTLKGPKALDLIQRITTNDASKLACGQAQYSCITNEKGGIVDDLIVYRTDTEEYLIVVNASNIEKNWNWIARHNTQGVHITNQSDDTCLFAVQGPKATTTLQKITSLPLETIKYYHFTKSTVAGIPDILISNTGYTGSGGFEIYVHKNYAVNIWETILKAGQTEGIKPIGLGARNTLRMEKGYCLYGNDIDDNTSPLEAGLGWIVKFTKAFTHADELKKQKEKGVQKKLIGFTMTEKGIPRQGYEIKNQQGATIGKVTSGALSPVLNIGIGLGYVTTANAKPNTEILISIRDKPIKASVKPLPLV